MNLRFRDDVTESEVRSVMGFSLDDESLLGFGCYTRIDLKEVKNYLLGIIFCPLAVPLMLGLSKMVMTETLDSFAANSESSPTTFIDLIGASFFGLFYLLLAVAMVVVTVMCFKKMKKTRKTIYYAYSPTAMFTKTDDLPISINPVIGTRYIKAKKHGKYGKVFVMYPLYLTLTPIMYVKDPVKFCEDYSGNPFIKVYLNSKLYSRIEK